MKNINNHKHCLKCAGLTLIEILTVVAIIAILVSILVPVLARQKVKVKANLARVECSSIAQAIFMYNADYPGFFPTADGQRANTPGDDLTFSMHVNPNSSKPNDPKVLTGEDPANADAIIILSALKELGGNKVNEENRGNPKMRVYLPVKLIDSKSKPGMGPDGIYRDPFNNPYVITVDKNGDGRCWDMLYGKTKVSGMGPPGAANNPEIGAHGLKAEMCDLDENPTTPDEVCGYTLMGKAMVWSAGPDQMVSPQHKARGEEFEINGFKGTNEDNIIGW